MVTPENDDNIQRTFSKWLFGQEANTVALYLILIALGYGGWWALTVGIPKHLEMIQRGYESINDRNTKALEGAGQRHSKDLEAVSSSFEKSLDRMERAFGEGKK